MTTASNDSMEYRTGRGTQGNGTYPVSADGCPYAAVGTHKESYETNLWLHADGDVRRICRSLKVFELTFSEKEEDSESSGGLVPIEKLPSVLPISVERQQTDHHLHSQALI